MDAPPERAALRKSWGRLRLAARPVAQSALAAGLAWFLAQDVFGFDRPFFAPVAAVISLGTTLGQRGRRAVEMAIGVAVGIAIADLIILGIGTGAVQIVLVTALAMAAAVLLGGSALLVNQAAVSAILVATISPPTANPIPYRFFHTLIGVGVALLVGQFLMPLQPLPLVQRAARPVFDGLGAALARTAAALAARDLGEAECALLDARAMDPQVRALHDALQVAQETARLAPTRRGIRGQVNQYEHAAAQVDLAVRNTRVLARASVVALQVGVDPPPEICAAVDDLAKGVRALGEQLLGEGDAGETRRFASSATARTRALFPDLRALAVSRIVGQIRATAVDLLRSSGMDLETAQRTLEQATHPPPSPGGD